MADGMWTAVSGAKAQFQKLDQIANNLANADTDGFKKDTTTFREYLSVLERPPLAKDIPRGAIRDSDFYPIDGRDQSHVVVDGTHTSLRSGPLKVTHHPFDFALDGKGFFEVETPQGIRWTRNGSFKLNSEGFLVTPEGHFVLRSDPPSSVEEKKESSLEVSPQLRKIQLLDLGELSFGVSESGELFLGDQLVARMSVVDFPNPKALRKQGNSLFKNQDANQQPSLVKSTKVLQGMLERSNVNPIEEMSQMIQTNRLFDHNLKALKTYGELMGKEANEIGKI